MSSFPFGQTVTLHRRVLSPTPDGYGNDQFVLVDELVDQVVVWDSGATETLQGRDTVTSDAEALLPPGVDPSTVDSMTLAGGDTYEVSTVAGQNVSPFTGLNPGVYVRLRRVTG